MTKITRLPSSSHLHVWHRLHVCMARHTQSSTTSASKLVSYYSHHRHFAHFQKAGIKTTNSSLIISLRNHISAFHLCSFTELHLLPTCTAVRECHLFANKTSSYMTGQLGIIDRCASQSFHWTLNLLQNKLLKGMLSSHCHCQKACITTLNIWNTIC